ncbi:MAG: phosphate signaling complex protein PhoU, partial [Carnobacterium sp.]
HIHFFQMGKAVNEAIYKYVKDFFNHDKALAKEVIAGDVAINKDEADLETRCFELIALQQPVTTDLRKIVTIMKASSDLERMGDHAVSIAKSTIRVKGNKRDYEIEAQIAEMSEKVKVMVQDVLQAYVVSDAKLAKKVALKDIEVDNDFKKIYKACIDQMKSDPEIVLGATDYMLIAGFIERIGDYVTNISEWIIYLDTGKMAELNTHNKNDRFFKV